MSGIAARGLRAQGKSIRRAGDNYQAPGQSLPFDVGPEHKVKVVAYLIAFTGTFFIPFGAARFSIHNKNLQGNAVWC